MKGQRQQAAGAIVVKQEKLRFDDEREANKFEVRHLVLLRKMIVHNDGKSKKLMPRYDPYLIKKVLNHCRYVVES